MTDDSGPIPAEEARRLRRWNLGVGIVHAVQATLLLVIASDVDLPVYASWIDGPPGAADLTLGDPLFHLPIAPAVAVFLYLAAVDHLLVASPSVRPWYERNLGRGINYARWSEYALSASLMVVLIAMLAGTWELSALIGLFAANAAMILFGLLMERGSKPGEDADWLPFRLGALAGIAPWIVIGAQLARGNAESGGVPSFVLVIFISLLALFSLFAVNMWLQYKQVGRWRSYLFGERAYIVLSLTAKSALAWQVYAGALAGS